MTRTGPPLSHTEGRAECTNQTSESGPLMDDQAPVARCAPVYHDAGWNPLELPQHAKGPPPEKRTGYEGIDMTPAEIGAAAWNGNIGLRMPFDVIGLDVDGYRGGKDSLRALVSKLGALPQTWISHNGRNDDSGIRFFRVPRRPAWVASLPGIDIIQRGHRYAAVWPSIHPDGRRYGWWDQTIGGPAEQVPNVDDLPDLPWPWIEELSRGSANDHTRAANGGQLNDFIDAHTRADMPGYITVIVEHFKVQTDAGGSRHDNMQHCLTWAMEHVRAGIVASKEAHNALAAEWTVAVAPDKRRAELFSPRRTTEWDAMLRHAVGKALAKTQAELHVLHDDIAGIPVNVSAPPTVIVAYQTSVPSVRAAGRNMTMPTTEHFQPKRARWLWDGRIPVASLSLLGGREGIGKSILSIDLIARTSTGKLEGEFFGTPSTVIIAATEDSWEHTIVPRLIVAGADRSRVRHVIVTEGDGTPGQLVLPHDIEEFTDAAIGYGTRLVVLDPLISRLDGSIDTHKDAEVRKGLEPLVAAADRGGFAVLGLIHVNKSSTNDPLTMLMASRAFTAVPRAVLFTALDTEQPGMRLLGQPKNNLGRIDIDTLMFGIGQAVAGQDPIDGQDIVTGKLQWAGVSQRSITEAMHDATRSPEAKTDLDDAADWLTDYLAAEQVVPSEEAKTAALGADITERTLKRARVKIGAGVTKYGFPRRTAWSAPGLDPDDVDKAIAQWGQTVGPTGKVGPTGRSGAKSHGPHSGAKPSIPSSTA